MVERVLVDNDVVLKAASYSLCDALLARTTLAGIPPAILGVAKYVVRGRLVRATGLNNRGNALDTFDQILAAVIELEPTDAELEIAAELEVEARRRDVELDGGESQLLAVLVTRGCDLMLTGDKRAISAVALVGPMAAHGRVGCLEQFMMDALSVVPFNSLRQSVCGEPLADRAIAICFACARAAAPSDGEVREGLTSYINHLSLAAPGVLFPGYDFSALHENA